MTAWSVLVALFVLHPAFLQALTGSVAGWVTDTGGGRLPGVTITATADGQTRTVITDSSGLYRIPDVRPGRYRFTARLSGFVQDSTDNILIEAEKTATLPFVLRIVAGPDPLLELRSFVDRYVGSQPIDCGHHLLTRTQNGFAQAGSAEFQRSIDCGVRSANERKPFWAFAQGVGVDSWIAQGLLGTAEGDIYRFWYDSAPCGGPGCAGRFEITRCARPFVATDRRTEFACGVVRQPAVMRMSYPTS